MEYTASIVIPDESVGVLLAAKDFSSERVQVEMKTTRGKVEFRIKASDSVALRAVCNSITKLLTVWEKTESL